MQETGVPLLGAGPQGIVCLYGALCESATTLPVPDMYSRDRSPPRRSRQRP
ncbi:hypothetical protein GSbR_18220 [Geobacter sp. SVR]|nr:hypothetical protein GSbR_18220 [Geobacter sp. SVR]